MKFRALAALISVAVFSVGAAVAQSNNARPAPQAPAQLPQPDKALLSYALGYDSGMSIAGTKADVDMSQVARGLQDGAGQKDAAYSREDMTRALGWLQQKLAAEGRAEFERIASENKKKSDAYIAQNRAKQGVVTLPSGIQYRVIDAGTGSKPTANSEVQLHFRYSLVTGREIANTYSSPEANPVSFKVDQFPLLGIREILPMMAAGSRWEVVLPADKAFGDSPNSPIGPSQALLFDVKVVSVK